MKRTIITSIAVLATLGAVAQGLSLRDRTDLNRHERCVSALETWQGTPAKVRKAAGAEQTEYVSALVRLTPETDPSSLGDGLIVQKCRAGFYIITMPREMASAVADHPAVKSFSLSRPVEMKMDRARLVSGIDKIHTGEGLPTKYTGRGVVAGVVDNGIDPNHINFLYPDGTSRVSMLSVAGMDRNGNPTTTIYTYDKMGSFTTDDKYNYHGTHTLGILAGSYDGEGKMAYKDANGQYVLDENCKRTPFYGVAPAADLAVGAGSSYDAYIVYNIENILNYAAQTHQRAVINLSLGSSVGPHDGSTSLNQYLDYICIDGEYEIDGETYKGDNAIICISAGNEGDMPIAWNKTISAEDPDAKSFVVSLMDDVYDAENDLTLKNMRMGHAYIYSNDARPFKVQVVAWNNTRNRIAWTKTLIEASDAVQYYCSSSQYQQSEGGLIDPAFANYFEGYVGLGTSIDPDNGRYFAILDVAAIDNIAGSNPDENYSLGVIVSYIAEDGKPQRVELYGDADGVQGYGALGKEGWIEPSGNGTISDMACGKNQIIVGAYNTKEDWLSLDGNVYSYGEGIIPEGEVTGFSSFGTLHDGRNLPHVLAPGASIVSSSNLYYHTASENVADGYNPMWLSVRQGETAFGGRDHYWVQMSGTSMACPVVAGAMALWLEANPNLNVNDIREIIAATSVKDEYTAKCPDQVKVGAGKFDAYAGLKEALRRAAVENVQGEGTELLVRALGDGHYEVALPNARSISVSMFDTTGRMVATANANGDEVVLDASAAIPGLYIIRANGSAAQKIMLP